MGCVASHRGPDAVTRTARRTPHALCSVGLARRCRVGTPHDGTARRSRIHADVSVCAQVVVWATADSMRLLRSHVGLVLRRLSLGRWRTLVDGRSARAMRVDARPHAQSESAHVQRTCMVRMELPLVRMPRAESLSTPPPPPGCKVPPQLCDGQTRHSVAAEARGVVRAACWVYARKG